MFSVISVFHKILPFFKLNGEKMEVRRQENGNASSPVYDTVQPSLWYLLIKLM